MSHSRSRGRSERWCVAPPRRAFESRGTRSARSPPADLVPRLRTRTQIGTAVLREAPSPTMGVPSECRGHCRFGRYRLRFLESPHVHHWDSMMVFEETTLSLLPSDLFPQPGDQPPVVTDDLSDEMCRFRWTSAPAGAARSEEPNECMMDSRPGSLHLDLERRPRP